MVGDTGSNPTLVINLGSGPVPVDPTKVPPLLEPFQSPEIIVDGIASLAVAGAMLRLTLFSERQMPTDGMGQISRVVVGRLVIAPQTAHYVAIVLRTALDQLVASGMIPALPAVTII